MSNKTKNDAIPESEALNILKELQGTTEILIPLIINGKVLHEGIKFEVNLTQYNSFLNESQSGKISMTASAKNFLMNIVSEEHASFLSEALKVKGVLNNMMMKINNKVEPSFGDSLD